LLQQAEEKELASRLVEVRQAAEPALTAERFGEAMAALSRLRRPVDAFFEKVTVNCDEPPLRLNRLKLLSQIRATMGAVADFSQIEGQ
jgi:glycyl-tRNA synthetase beta chain